MSPRPLARTRLALIGLVAVTFAGVIALPGCDPRSILYFLQPFEPTLPAPGPSLKSKKVVILTHVADNSLGEFQSLDREMNRELIRILKAGVKKIEIVDPEKVASWVEAHPTWTDPGELAKAFDTDLVIFLEVQEFQIQDPRSPGLLEGNAEVQIQVIEFAHPKNSKGKVNTSQPKETNRIYNESWKTTFPKRSPVSVDSVSPSVFKSKFLKLVATELSWQFMEHAPGDDIQDTRINGH